MFISEWIRRVWYLLHRERIERDLQREMEGHRAMMDDPRDFGNALRLREESRETWGWNWLDHLGQDVRYAVRGFRRAPGFTIAAILAAALGIGASTAVFSVVDRILFRGLPYSEADRLVSVGLQTPMDANEFLPGEDYRKWKSGQTAFESMTAFAAIAGASAGGNCDLADKTPVRLNCAFVDSTFLSTFGVHPAMGRDFTESDVEVKFPNVVLLSYSLWKTHFSGAADVVGKTISLDGQPATVIGVLPLSFEMPTLGPADLLVPLTSKSAFVRAFARLRAGVSIPQAEQMFAPLFEDALKFTGSIFGRDKVRLQIRSVRDRQVQDVRTASYILLTAVFLVLIIACTNVANLMLARASAREREFAVRGALGAGRSRLIRQTLTESLLLSTAGGGAGLVLAYSALRVFVLIAPEGIPRLAQATLDGQVLLFALTASISSGILFGIAPALHLPTGDVLRARTSGVSLGRFRNVLVAGQIALSVVLLSGGVLLLRTLWNLERVPLGMEPESVIAVFLRLGQAQYPHQEQQFAFYEDLENRIQATPGLEKFAIVDSVPPGGGGDMALAGFHIEGSSDISADKSGHVRFRHVTPGYFSVLGVPLLRGRVFTDLDREPKAHVVILSETMAHKLFPREDPVGRHFRFDDDKQETTVVGIVADVKNNPSLAGADDPEEYLPRAHDKSSAGSLGSVLIRTTMDAKSIETALRKIVDDIDPTLPVTIQPMPQYLAKLTDRPRFTAALLGAFAVTAVLLAGVGLSGILSFFVIQRTQEIGVRMALGATAQSVVRLIVLYALRWTLTGVFVGIALSLFATQALRSLLYHVPERDPWTLIVTGATLLSVALIAAWVPSRRASRIDPVIALRHD